MNLAEQQKQFGAYIRDPQSVAVPDGLDERRLGVYRELVFNNIESLMANNFPVICAILEDVHWRSLVREFLRDYRTNNPYFPRLGQVFIAFLESREAKPGDPDFLVELAHYENIEFELFMADEDFSLDARPSVLDGKSSLRLASTATPLAYQYPVQRISTQWQPDETPLMPTFLLAFQDIDGDVRFFELQGLTYHLLVMIQENENEDLDDIVKTLADSVRDNDPTFRMNNETFLHNALAMLKQFDELCVLRDNRLI